MTGATPIASARLILSDSGGTPRWSDATLLGYENDGLRYAYRERPDLHLAAGGTMGTFTALATTAATFPLADDASEAIAAYITAKALSEDDADKENLGRAQMRMAEFKAWLVGA